MNIVQIRYHAKKNDHLTFFINTPCHYVCFALLKSAILSYFTQNGSKKNNKKAFVS